MQRRLFLAVFLTLAGIAPAIAQEPGADPESAGPRLPNWAYVCCCGSFELKGGAGEAMYCPPHGTFVHSKLQFAPSPWQDGWWYRQLNSPFYLGFSAHPDCCGRYPIYIGHYDTNDHWHSQCLCDACICHYHP